MIKHISPSDVVDLTYTPSFEFEDMNVLDGFAAYDHWCESQDMEPCYHGSVEFTPDNHKVLLDCLRATGDKVIQIVEIGVNRNGEYSSTQTLIKEKAKGSTYLGIDLRDISYLNSPESDVYVASKTSSHDINKIQVILKDLNITKIDLLIIDGDHSINAVLKDWRNFSILVPKGGIIFLHDVNHHPGPRELFQAVDENKFIKLLYCPNDYGVGVLIRK